MLPREARLRKDREFRAVFSKRRTYGSERLAVYVRPRRAENGNEPVSRVGFVISRKTARRAHDRNRLKRRLREIFRLNVWPRLRGSALDIVIVARPPALDVDYARLAADVENLGRKAGFL